MKNIMILGCALMLLTACGKASKEVRVDETKTETPGDTVAKKDSAKVASTVSQSSKDQKEAASPAPAQVEVATKLPDNTPVTTKAIGKVPAKTYASFGLKITADNALDKSQMLKKYESLKKGDTIAAKFRSGVTSVCKKKGCWMKMSLADDKETFVRFKDYGFFVPLNADNSEAVVSGRAFVDVISVDELKHYAKDGGKSQEEIDKITAPKITYAFQADGVLLAQ